MLNFLLKKQKRFKVTIDILTFVVLEQHIINHRIKKLIAHGCSFTYGDELPDTNLSWPVVLAKKLNTQCTNLGVPGYSNDSILDDLIKADLSDAFVIVCWTTYLRQRNTPIRIVASMDDKSLYGKWLLQVILLQDYLKTKQVPYLFFNAFDTQHQYDKYKNDFTDYKDKIDTSNFLGWPYEGFVEWAWPSPTGPRGHPLEEGHAKVAEVIWEHLNGSSTT